MKKILTTICLVFTLFMAGRAQTGFVVSGNGGFSVGQIFAIPAVNSDGISSSPGVQQGYIFIHEYEDDRCEGYAYNGYGFSLPATANPVDTLLVKYDPDVRDQYGYDSITHLQLRIHLTEHTLDTTIYLVNYDDPRFGTAYGLQTLTYSTTEFGCDSIVELLVYRLDTILDTTVTAHASVSCIVVDSEPKSPSIFASDFSTVQAASTFSAIRSFLSDAVVAASVSCIVVDSELKSLSIFSSDFLTVQAASTFSDFILFLFDATVFFSVFLSINKLLNISSIIAAFSLSLFGLITKPFSVILPSILPDFFLPLQIIYEYR